MTTSNLYSNALNTNELATESFDILQVGRDGETLTGDMIGRFKKSANLVLKEWQAQGIHLWTYTEGTLFLEVGQEEYDFRLSTTRAANTWFETTTTADTVADATVLEVTSVDDMAEGENIGVIQDNNDLFWSTIKDITDLNVTLDDAIPRVTQTGAAVRTYAVGTATSPELIPISRILNVRRKEQDDYEIPIVFESREDYFDLPNKEQQGTPIQAHYSRQDRAHETSGIMYLWNTPGSSVPVINFTYERKLQILNDAEDTLDLPDYAQEAFVYACAVKLIPKFGSSIERVNFIVAQAERLKNDMMAYDSAIYPIRMNMERYG